MINFFMAAGLLAIAMHASGQTARQSFSLYNYSIDNERHIHIDGGIPQTEIGIASKTYTGKEVALITTNAQGGADFKLPNADLPSFAVSRKSYTANKVQGNGKVVFFKEDEFGIKDLQLKQEAGSTVITWNAATGTEATIRYDILASKDNTNFTPNQHRYWYARQRAIIHRCRR